MCPYYYHLNLLPANSVVYKYTNWKRAHNRIIFEIILVKIPIADVRMSIEKEVFKVLQHQSFIISSLC